MIKKPETIDTSVDYDSDTEDGLTMHLKIAPGKNEVFLTTETMNDQRKIDLFLEWADKMTVEEMERRLSRKLDFDDVRGEIRDCIKHGESTDWGYNGEDEYEYDVFELNIATDSVVKFLKKHFE